MKYARDPASGMPWLPAQTCIAQAVVTEDATSNEVAGILVLPNLLVWWEQLPGTPYRTGESRVCGTRIARQIADEYLPAVAAHVTECEGEACGHAGHSMEVIACGT